MKTTRRPASIAAFLPLLVAGLLLCLSQDSAQAQGGAWETPPPAQGAAPPPAPAPVPAPSAAVPPPAPEDRAPYTQVVVTCPGCRGGKGSCCHQEARDETWEPTPVGGYTLPKGGFALKLEFGYPHMDVGVLFALGNRIQIGVGYRSVYTINHTPYANVKLSLNSRNRDVLGLALELGTGYSFGREDYENIGNRMAGEYHVFGEAWLRGTARRGRHGLLFGVGARISQAAPGWSYDYESGEGGGVADEVMATISLELGYELRINRVSSFFLATGVDIFTSEEWIPALIRFRMGVIVGS